MGIIRFYRVPGLSGGATSIKLKQLQREIPIVAALKSELCFNVEINRPLSSAEEGKLKWILSSPFEPQNLSSEPTLAGDELGDLLIEIGPRLNFSTAFSSNAVSICHSVGLKQITRLEVSMRYLIVWEQKGLSIKPSLVEQVSGVLHDRMTECQYLKPVESFDLGIHPEPWFEVDILKEGRKALEEVNQQLGLAFDNWDLDFYTDLFKNKLKRNPTSVECFDLAQSNSEHSRHWFFKGLMVLDGKEQSDSLIDMIIDTQNSSNSNNVIKFSDNSSAIKGFEVSSLQPSNPTEASSFNKVNGLSHLIFTAETHNFPTGVAPFSGATTGTGGRIRDVHAVGRGGHYIAGTAGYSVGNLLIPDYRLPWEDRTQSYPNNFAPPLEILVEASNGASDYGNKFGEPVICGFARSFGLVDSSGERREWIKPIMFSGGVGSLDANMISKLAPEKGMQVVKLGGPVYRIGVGGGSASSVEVQGDNKSELDFGAVQRGDAEMEQKLHRVIRACLEMGDANPICSIHDQGAGGNGNVLKELVEPAGAVIFTRNFQLGDPTISTMELWGAEYQENDALLCRAEDVPILKQIDEVPDDKKFLDGSFEKEKAKYPVDLELELVLGKMPRKTFVLDRQPSIVKSLSFPKALTVLGALDRVLRLPSVSSKRFLTNKVDRCVTGLVAQQQCVGPLHTPLADVAVTALSHFNFEGIATAIGEQPIKGLINAAAGARMTVGEALSNLVFAAITDIQDVKCSGNWMWAAKLPGEGAALYEACVAMCKVMCELGVAVDGGKDSLRTLVVSTYAPCPDIRKVVTPDLKSPALGNSGVLLWVDLSGGKNRLGGSALAQCYSQLGDEPADMDNAALFKQAFKATQKLIKEDKILAGHDISDGGLITCLLEMAFGGISGFVVNVTHKTGAMLDVLFAEELGWVLEIDADNKEYVLQTMKSHGVPCFVIGRSAAYGMNAQTRVLSLRSDVLTLFTTWEETSYRLERRQANPDCVRHEFQNLGSRKGPNYKLTFNPAIEPRPEKPISALFLHPVVSNALCSKKNFLQRVNKFLKICLTALRVAVIREEGTNGDREMAASLFMAGFEVWDVTMQDLLNKKVTADQFRGLIFPGGFSYADVLGSAKGWAASLLFNPVLRKQFQAFAEKKDTFSLGVCNGCQLMSLLGWLNIDKQGLENEIPSPDIVLDHNVSERFECRFSTVRIESSPSIMLRGMEGSSFGVWVAHGEGRFTFRNNDVLSKLESKKCCPIKYVDDDGEPTMYYPMNPNGSIHGIAAVCSADGRHLAMMPHPERATLLWQWPWMPPQWKDKYQVSPWLRIFQNAFVWSASR
ncbi:CLUMA_CG000196, isoform A [Gryllus bimaculatus]|nr:CLUMA_CG000196, isoform A [Gryllus bimaculatus]